MRRPEQGPPAAASLAQAERREDSVQDGIADVDAKDGASTGEGLSQIDEGRLQRRLDPRTIRIFSSPTRQHTHQVILEQYRLTLASSS